MVFHGDVRKTPIVLAVILGLAPAVAGAQEPPAPPAPLPAGDHDLALEHGGRTRHYLVHVPPGAPPAGGRPVVVSFHGGGGSGAIQQRMDGLDRVADTEGFLVVYPDGTGRLERYLLTWNAGPCCGYAYEHAVDDVGFTLALLGDLSGRVGVDATHVYATGLSNGAMMAYRLAADAPDRIAAIAPVAGALSLPDLKLPEPVPVMHFHSVDDPRAVYPGGLGPPFPFTQVRVEHPSVERVIAQWRRADGCPDEPVTGPTAHGTPGASDAEHTATRLVYGPCAGGAEVVLWRLTGAGHVWPGAPTMWFQRWLGPATQVVDASAEMAHFFRRYARPDARPFVSAPSRDR